MNHPASAAKSLLVLVLLAACVGASAGCGDLPIPPRYVPNAIDAILQGLSIRTTGRANLNIPYGEDPMQRVDIYTPEGAGPWPVVVFVHGGTWQYTTRLEYSCLGLTLTDAGFVTVLIDYRVYPQVTYPAFADDTVDALNWVFANVGEYGGDPERMVIMGHSAGSHLAVLTLTDDRFRDRLAFDPLAIKGIAAYSGPFDFYAADPAMFDDLLEVMGSVENLDAANPMYHVRGDVPPLLIAVGGDDVVTFPEQCLDYALAMEDAGAQVRYEEFRWIDHYTILLEMVTGHLGGPFDVLLAFLDEVTGDRGKPTGGDNRSTVTSARIR